MLLFLFLVSINFVVKKHFLMCSKIVKTLNRGDVCTPVFVAALNGVTYIGIERNNKNIT